ncbi:hypothetical protein [Bacillus sp. FJAT-27445]|uniref:hypothetical protein n=1 Tax=Bacillus sp. FJAT-27445 TaxID=1679166 RepID=UPI0007436429|nr:hypothetical protein [Bacillus sp. FJAT-27445]
MDWDKEIDKSNSLEQEQKINQEKTLNLNAIPLNHKRNSGKKSNTEIIEASAWLKSQAIPFTLITVFKIAFIPNSGSF